MKHNKCKHNWDLISVDGDSPDMYVCQDCGKEEPFEEGKYENIKEVV